jgi:murein L,D-transpeptidase YafK
MKTNWSFIAALICLAGSPLPLKAMEHSLPEGLISFSKAGFSESALVVDKSKKKIYVFKDKNGLPILDTTYDADLGKKPGDKHSTGDSRTPEGIYFFERLIEAQNLDYQKYGVLAFVTNYPNFFDQLDGKSGYGIWLHAITEKETLERGSQGCVVVRNDTIKKLRPEIKLKYTPLMIFDQINWVDETAIQKSKELFLQKLAQWKNTWQTKDMDTYISMYHPDFKFGKMSLKKFKEYKTELSQKYATINVKLSEAQVFEHHGNVIMRFYQDYQSPEHSDFGEKILYFKKLGDDFKIIGEFWIPVEDESKKPLANL